MAFITRDVVTANGVTKKAFYKLVGMESEDGTIVQIKQFVGEYTIEDIQSQKDQILLQLAEIDEKLSNFA